MPAAQPGPATSGPLPVMTIVLSCTDLVRSFRRCGLVADHVATVAASHTLDPEQLGSRLSACLEEMLELARRYACPRDRLVIRVEHEPGALHVHAEVPVEGAVGLMVERLAVLSLPVEEARQRYVSGFAALLDEPDPVAGLLEQAALYGVRFHVARQKNGLTVTAILKTA